MLHTSVHEIPRATLERERALRCANTNLSAFECWMVRSNLDTAREQGITLREQSERLRANGYHRVADAVEAGVA